MYWQTAEEQEIAKLSKQRLEESKTFDEPIAVEIVPFTTFFDAEEEHQDFYKKESDYYNSYKK
ncbi:peptide-methionine (S)-S-oxide reductase [Patescibacteria group bacterium]|nr:peptide-methionine (S)-S-oxide reductase [Patescibacteria group bacterium]